MSPEPRTVGLMRNSRKEHTKELLQRHYPELHVRDVHEVSDLSQVDFVLAGGGKDIDPALYGQENRACKSFSPADDWTDLRLLEETLVRGLPFLGICRGAQLLNIVLGGTLYQDLALETGQAHAKTHRIIYDTRLHARFAGLETVNSTHHQGIQRLAGTLTTLAQAEDSIPELVWCPGAIGVQFHPETLIREDKRWKTLFDWWLTGATVRKED